jgi:hypothetical protein
MVRYSVIVEIDGAVKPALVAEWLTIVVMSEDHAKVGAT